MLTNLRNEAVGFFRRRRWLVWICLLALMATIGITLSNREGGRPRRAQSPQPRKPIAYCASFQGYSNSPSGQRWAILTVTNRDFGELGFANPMTVQFSDDPMDDQDVHWKGPDGIPPGSFGRIAVEIPPGRGAWRARCIIWRWTWRDSAYNAFSSRNWPAHLIPVRRTHTMDEFVTEWVRE